MAIPEPSGFPRRGVQGAYSRQNKGDPGGRGWALVNNMYEGLETTGGGTTELTTEAKTTKGDNTE